MDHELNEAGEALGAALDARSPHRPPSELRDRVLREAVRRGQGGTRQRAFGLPFAVGAAALVLLLAGSLAWGLSLNAALAQERSLRLQLSDAAAKDEVVFDVVDARNVAKTTLRSTTDDSPPAPYGKAFLPPPIPHPLPTPRRLP